MSDIVTAIGFGLVTASILALGAVGFTLQFGVTNVFNLAYGQVMTVGMFIAYAVNVTAHASIWLGFAAGAIGGAAVTGLLDRLLFTPFLRRGASYTNIIMASLALGIVIENVLLVTAGSSSYAFRRMPQSAVHILGMSFTPVQLAIIALSVLTMVALHSVLRYTGLGRAMRATAANIGLARSSGISTDRVTLIAWVLSGAFCGAAGVAFALNLASFEHTSGSAFLLVIVAAAVFGGIGQPYGAMLGALIIGVATELAALISPDLKDIVAFALLALMLLIRPNGLIAAPEPPAEAATR